jgi:hypothetical protein
MPSDGRDVSAFTCLRQQYFALVPARLLRLPASTTLACLEGQAYLISRLLGEIRFPQPEDGYRRLFWRTMIRELEAGLRELEDTAREYGNDDLVRLFHLKAHIAQ